MTPVDVKHRRYRYAASPTPVGSTHADGASPDARNQALKAARSFLDVLNVPPLGTKTTTRAKSLEKGKTK